tara:strand:+ start:2953 stop:4203 length:1251 start_codon:yes stop_codon:yes gene_type:complete
MAKPKLALIPAAQGSKFYSVLPSSGVGDFDFTRSGSATRINSQGLIETVANGVSRLNYPLIDGKVVGCPSHLLENSATNLQVNSEEFDNTLWNKARASITPNDAISPSGLLNADKLVGTSGTSSYLFDGVSVVSGSVYTISVFAKYIDISEFVIVNFTQSGNAYFNIENGTVISNFGTITEPKIENYGNGWYRCSVKFTANATQAVAYGPFLNNATDKSVNIWGASFELGDYVTSYIPTTTSTVTRSAETANGSGDTSTFNNSEGVLMAEISALTNNNPLFNSLSIASGTTNVLSIGFSDSLNKLYVFKTNGSSSWFEEVLVNDITNFNKIALSYESNDNQFWINGFKIKTNNSIGINPSAMSDMDFNAAVGNEFMYSNTKQIQYYNSALTESELETLTSWVSFSDMANGQLYTIQ